MLVEEMADRTCKKKKRKRFQNYLSLENSNSKFLNDSFRFNDFFMNSMIHNF